MLDPSQTVGRLFGQIETFFSEARGVIEEMRSVVKKKEDGSLVTSADLYVQSCLQKLVRAEFPVATFVCEEGTQSPEALLGPLVAIIDPIDGTENFASGLPIWGSCLGLWENGSGIGAILLLPDLGVVLRSDRPEALWQSRIAGFSSSYNDRIGEGIKSSEAPRIFGCAVFSLWATATGRMATFANPRGTWVWDFLPGAQIILAFGGMIWVDGSPWTGQLIDSGVPHEFVCRTPQRSHTNSKGLP